MPDPPWHGMACTASQAVPCHGLLQAASGDRPIAVVRGVEKNDFSVGVFALIFAGIRGGFV